MRVRICQFLLPFSLLICTSLHAAWYKGNAQQPISDMNFDEVRAQTIKNAIANAALKSSSYIRAEDIALDGLLLSSKTVLQSEGHIRRVDIISETIIDGVLAVVVNVDFKTLNDCQQSRYAKSLLITQFPLVKPLQARTGAIFDFDHHVVTRLKNQLTAHPTLVAPQLLDAVITPNNQSAIAWRTTLLENARYIANQHQKQFVLLGNIRDISLFEQFKDNLLIDEVTTRRNFTLQVYLIDAISNKIVFDKRYHSEANWQYPINHQVDTNNSLFWRGDFGRSVLNTINSAVTDITNQLRCQSVLAQIIHKRGNQLMINMGQHHGVNIGDTFEVILQQQIYSNTGHINRLLVPKTSSKLTVIEANETHAIVESDDLALIDDVQLNDYLKSTITF
ncbi:flagella assembly protein FlgT middle domain-containing protein [Thalassotalea fusca]